MTMDSRLPHRPLWLSALCLPLLLGAGVAGSAQAQSRGDGRHYDNDRGYSGGIHAVRCESIRNRSKECRLDGRARLVRQLSGAACVEGRSWGQSRDGVWVNDGCRAEFVGEQRGRPSRPGHGGGNGWGSSGQVVDCDSNDRRQRRCNVTIRRDARLVRQKSGSPCIEGQSWGWDRNGLWVSNGCRGQFQVR